jgi:signal transduction histidine kinase/CheY-like chemotaxis protein
MKYTPLPIEEPEHIKESLSLKIGDSDTGYHFKKVMKLGSHLFAPSVPLAGVADYMVQWFKAMVGNNGSITTGSEDQDTQAKKESRIYNMTFGLTGDTVKSDASPPTLNDSIKPYLQYSSLSSLKEADGYRHISARRPRPNGDDEEQHTNDPVAGQLMFAAPRLRRLQPEEKTPVHQEPETIWSEAEQMAQIACWEYDTATEAFSSTAYLSKLLRAPEGKAIDHFLSLLPYFAEPDREALFHGWNQALYFGCDFNHVCRLSHTKEPLWLKLIIKAIYKDAKLLKVVGTLQDVTEFQEAAVKLEEDKVTAEQATKVKSEFVSLMSHEIRTPLNAIMGLTHLLLQEEDIAEEHRNYLQSIHFSSHNMLSLINNTLDYSRIEAGKIELEKVNFDLHDLLKSIHRSLHLRASEKQLSFDLCTDKDTPAEVAGDPARLTQILNNLTSNAIRFTDKGSIKLAVDVVYQSDSDWILEFSVTDTGVGIPEERQQEIFESFVQASAATHRQFGGTGLGLAITKKLVELHKGNIRVKSNPGLGSTFSVRLRYLKPHTAFVTLDKACQTETLEERLKDVKVLVVDDNPINKMVASKLLLSWHADVDTAEDGPSALEKIRNGAFDLVLMDLHMPNMNGFEAITEIRKLGKTMPVIALTANASEEEKKKILELGGNDYITKPFVPQVLCNTLLHHLNTASA